MILNYSLKFTTYLFVFFISISAFCQEKIDKEYKQLDSLNRVFNRNPDSLLVYAQKLLDYSEKNNIQQGKKSAYRSLGFANSRLRNYAKSINNYHKALSLALQTGDKRLEHIVYNDLSINYRVTKFYDSSVYYSRKLIKYYEVSRQQPQLNLNYMNAGDTYFVQSKLDSAQFYLEKAIKGFYNTKNVQPLATSLTNLSEVHFQKGEYTTALKWADSSRGLIENLKLQRNYGRIYNLLGRVHKNLGNENDYQYYLQKEREYQPKRIDSLEVRGDAANETYNKSVYKYKKEAEDDMIEQNAFYKSNLFKMLILAILLGCAIIFLVYRNSISKKELKLLRDKIDEAQANPKRKPKTPLDLIYLKNKLVIDTQELLYIKSDGHYLEFYIEGKTTPELDRNTLTGILEILPPLLFVRIHKSYIVNIGHIKIINSTKLMLKNGTWINLSRTYKQQLKQMLNIG
jgi:tetratricopeptide (TPR) repeat protein